jgi:CRP-like cAMP-binding protein
MSDGEEEVRADLAAALPRLTAVQIAEVSPKFRRELYGPGENIVRQGDPSNRFFVIIEGYAEVCHEALDGHIEVVDTRKQGEYFGEIGLLKDAPRSATVRAPRDSSVEVLALDHEDFDEMIGESRGTEAQVAREMIVRLIQLANFQD